MPIVGWMLEVTMMDGWDVNFSYYLVTYLPEVTDHTNRSRTEYNIQILALSKIFDRKYIKKKLTQLQLQKIR